MITRTAYKDRPAVVVDTGTLTAVFLPEDGGKMASLKTAEGRELLIQTAGAAYKRLTPEGSYIDAECSGFDDMFPAIDLYDDPVYGSYPDHGEICRLPFEWETRERLFTMSVPSRLFPVVFSKTVRVSDDGALLIDYHIRNDGDAPFPCLWAAHCMLAWEEGMEVVSPYPPGAPVRTMFGPEGRPRDRLPGPLAGISTHKYYYTEPVPAGFCGVRYPAKKEALMLRYDPAAVPWLGVWLNNGGFKSMYCIALEPATAPYDVPAEGENRPPCVISPRRALTFTLTIALEREGSSL